MTSSVVKAAPVFLGAALLELSVDVLESLLADRVVFLGAGVGAFGVPEFVDCWTEFGYYTESFLLWRLCVFVSVKLCGRLEESFLSVGEILKAHLSLNLYLEK